MSIIKYFIILELLHIKMEIFFLKNDFASQCPHSEDGCTEHKRMQALLIEAFIPAPHTLIHL